MIKDQRRTTITAEAAEFAEKFPGKLGVLGG
jgi:hypothetical protein